MDVLVLANADELATTDYPRTRLRTTIDRSFRVTAAHAWGTCRLLATVQCHCNRQLETFLFAKKIFITVNV